MDKRCPSDPAAPGAQQRPGQHSGAGDTAQPEGNRYGIPARRATRGLGPLGAASHCPPAAGGARARPQPTGAKAGKGVDGARRNGFRITEVSVTYRSHRPQSLATLKSGIGCAGEVSSTQSHALGSLGNSCPARCQKGTGGSPAGFWALSDERKTLQQRS